MEPKITLAGREYLAQLKETMEGNQMEGKKQRDKLPDLAARISKVTDAWIDIEREYDVSKKIIWQKNQLC